MSASFLVGEGGQTWLIGVGTQRMAIREGRFDYQGGSLPARCRRRCCRSSSRRFDAIAGLRGFVGVDFIWNAESGVPPSSRSTRDRRLRTSGCAGSFPRVAGAGMAGGLRTGRAETRKSLAGLARLHCIGTGTSGCHSVPTARFALMKLEHADLMSSRFSGTWPDQWIGLDIGGANIKTAHEDGTGPDCTV